MREKLILLFTFILITSCQKNTIEPATVDPLLKVENGSYGNCSFLETPVYIVNKDYVIYQDCYTHKIIIADAASFGTKELSREGFAFDKNGIFVKGEFLKIDTTGFAFLGNNEKLDLWWEAKTKVFKNTTELKGADADTFPRNHGKKQKMVLNNKDANKIKIDYNFYKEENHIYFRNKRTGFDVGTFTSIDKSHLYYKDKDVVFYIDDDKGGIQKLNEVDVNSVRIFNNFLIDKNYLYSENIKIIKSNAIELLAIFPGYRSGCGFDETPGSNFYLFKNIDGFWLVKFSNTVSKRFLGKIFDRNWDPAFDVVDLHKKYGNTRINLPLTPGELALKQAENQVYSTTAVDHSPEYPGGINGFTDFVKKNYAVPKYLIENDIKVKVYASFVIEKDGSLSDIKIRRDPGYGTGKEFVRVLKLIPSWKPATVNRKPVRCLTNIPFNVNDF
ncbi:DKNYY domain-containing protein [Flavobacterium sp. PL02]|jgi:hypothetical protein|uniref:DKNYY domain-containing protein n=1 Tax=Flavobacterium sp. PL02 TaxID=3088354 RepID=UPI002B23E338|nr:DKNYY domain-containing protein [Flavobacterium sp. PL02]MEA9412973.1 DKNYY domain-containing protein [Flavobacterium sp. PL02]